MSTHSQLMFMVAQRKKAPDSTRSMEFLHRSAAGYVVFLCTLLAVCALLATLLPINALFAAPAAAPLSVTVELLAVEDAGAIESVPTFTGGGAPYFVLNSRPGGDFDYNFVQFDLAALPAGATIDSAVFRLQVNAAANPLDIELGRVDGAWAEGTLTWNNKPAVTWAGFTRNAPAAGAVEWPIKPLLTGWLDGSQTNYGVVLRGLTPATGGVRADTRDGAVAPRLVVTYTLPADEAPRPDLGDAPDSTNHHGAPNTAYAGAGILGNFPTVWDVPAGQVAGPRHANQTMEGWLGDFLSRENEADQGPDQDGPNNILRSAAGVIGDVADRDRGDDGWRNRNVKFFDCRRTTLEVRVSKAAAATRNFMYLNVWFDGNRDGDWADISPCQATESAPAQAGYEWIVQNYVVDMTAIPAGGANNFLVNSEKVFNGAEGMPHWMRFTLSEEPAVQPPLAGEGPGLPDGRGPHPAGAPGSYRFGETEDIFQKPSPTGEDGVLELQKRVITTAQPTEWIDYVTYEIRLRHAGGSQPVQAQIRDELPYPLIVYPTIDANGVAYVTVQSPTGGAVPLQATLDVRPPQAGNPPQQVVQWEGAIAPDAEVVLSFQVRVLALCEPNQQTITFTNTALARKAGGPILTATDDFTAKCIGYDESNLDFELEPITDVIDLDDLTHVPVRFTVTNSHAISVSLGFFQTPGNGARMPAAPGLPRFLDRATLAPNAAAFVDLELRMEAEFSDELKLPDDYMPTAQIAFCVLPDDSHHCPDALKYPQLHGELPPVQIPLRRHDLGDAPDSSNHAGAAMTAYPGVPAHFPTVFDAATGLPEGPLHRYPRPFHLGKRVSLEAEADIGPDQDPQHNIEPVANDPDNDRGDDGVNLALWNLNNCQTTNLPVQVFISPAAVAYFQQLGTPGYLNVWLDSNRDGDWQDATQCGAQPAVEHIAIDQPVNVAALGAGLHIVNVPTGLVPWVVANQPAWVRITLSERLSNKTLTAGALNYGDGRGYAMPFKTGETEDYFYRPVGANGAGPDMEVVMHAITTRRTVQDLMARSHDKYANQEVSYFKVDYGNVGTAAAQNALLEFQIPEKLRDSEIILFQAPGIPSQNISFNFDKIQMTLGTLAPGQAGTVILGWYGCITCTRASGIAADIQANVTVQLAGDVDAGNNQSSAIARGLLSSPIIGAFMDYTDDALLDRVVMGRAATCRAAQTLHGRAEPNRIIAILIGLVQVGATTSDADGDFSFALTLPNGFHRISARYAEENGARDAMIVSPRDSASGQATGILVNDALPYDPMSVTFTDSQGRTIAVPTLGYSFGVTQGVIWLRSGETYTMSVDSCGGSTHRQKGETTLGDVVVSVLTDLDSDGRYQGTFTYNPTVRAASAANGDELGLIFGDGNTQQRFSAAVQALPTAVVRSRANAQPLAGAAVAALVAQATESAAAFFDLAAASVLGQANPTLTGADGGYGFVAPAGTYRLDVTQNGYQPYRTGAIAVDDGVLAQDISLTPTIGEAATNTVYMTADGFDPAVLTVQPGSVVEWVNLDLVEHGARHANVWDSGMLAAGARFKVKFDAAGTFVYTDTASPLSQGVIIVDSTPALSHPIFLPVVTR